MATVRMADFRKNDIVRRAREKFNSINTKRELDPKYAEEVFSKNMSDQIVKYKQFMDTTFPSVETRSTTISQIKLKTTEDNVYTLPLLSEKTVPTALVSSSYDSYVSFTDIPANHPAVLHWISVADFNRDIDTKEQDYCNQVRGMLNKFPTLNQALTAFPSLSKLCDAEDVAKVHKKVDRGARRAELQTIADEEGQALKEVLLTSDLLGDDNV